MLFNGANGAEKVELSANGNRLQVLRATSPASRWTPPASRPVDFNALGGADLVTVNDLTGTDVTDVNVDLAGTLGGATGDGAADRVVVDGTNGDDAIKVSGDATDVTARARPRGRRSSTRRLPTGSTSTRRRAPTRWTPPGWPPVRSSSSWTACSSRRGTLTQQACGAATRRPRRHSTPLSPKGTPMKRKRHNTHRRRRDLRDRTGLDRLRQHGVFRGRLRLADRRERPHRADRRDGRHQAHVARSRRSSTARAARSTCSRRTRAVAARARDPARSTGRRCSPTARPSPAPA